MTEIFQNKKISCMLGKNRIVFTIKKLGIDLDFPDGPVIKIPHFQSKWGMPLIPGQGSKILHAGEY